MKECSIKTLPFSQEAFWHSSAHILGYAIESHYEDSLLTVGPATENGFFYDFFSASGQVVTEKDYSALEKLVKGIIKAKHPFERLEVSKE